MADRLSVQRALLVAGALGTLWSVTPAFAQQPPAPAAAPPPSSPLTGRPNTEAAMKLVPIATPPNPTPSDKIPLDKLKAARGFKLETYVTGIYAARSMRVSEKGTLFVTGRQGDKVHAVVDKGGRREVKVIASGLHRPNGLAIKDGTLYIAELSRISRIEKVEETFDNPGKPVTIYDDLPKDETHGWKFIGIGPDNKLYVPVGIPCNNCLPPDTHGQIRRISLNGTGMEVVARGVRQTVGFDWHPVTKELYFTDNGRDWLSEDFPEDELNRVTRVGQHFGAPFCYQGDFPDPEFGWGRSCDEFEKPVAKLGPHAAALGMRFYTGAMFPAKYRNAIFIARRGSWNRTRKAGGDVIAVFLNKDGTVKSMETVVTGFIQDNNFVARPVDVEMLKDGSLLISDDYNGAIYRLSYGSGTAAGAK
jgi:glucose/arabinose dehydrogenase